MKPSEPEASKKMRTLLNSSPLPPTITFSLIQGYGDPNVTRDNSQKTLKPESTYYSDLQTYHETLKENHKSSKNEKIISGLESLPGPVQTLTSVHQIRDLDDYERMKGESLCLECLTPISTSDSVSFACGYKTLGLFHNKEFSPLSGHDFDKLISDRIWNRVKNLKSSSTSVQTEEAESTTPKIGQIQSARTSSSHELHEIIHRPGCIPMIHNQHVTCHRTALIRSILSSYTSSPSPLLCPCGETIASVEDLKKLSHGVRNFLSDVLTLSKETRGVEGPRSFRLDLQRFYFNHKTQSWYRMRDSDKETEDTFHNQEKFIENEEEKNWRGDLIDYENHPYNQDIELKGNINMTLQKL